MKILFVIDRYYPQVNGVYSFVRRLASHLQESGVEVAAIAPSESPAYSYSTIDGMNIYCIPSVPGLFYKGLRLPICILLRKRLNRIISDYKPDIIHLQNHFILNTAVIKANRRYNIPVVATNHFMSENSTPFFSCVFIRNLVSKWLWNSLKVFNHAIIVTTPSQTDAHILRDRLNVKVYVISNGIDLERFYPSIRSLLIRQKYAIPQKPVLLYAGRVDSERHLVEVLRAVALAVKRVDLHFAIVGKGISMKLFRQLVLKHGIEKYVIFTGFVPGVDIPSLYRISRCVITAGITELQSIATMEAMASGLPVMAIDSYALSELIHHGVNGYLFRLGDTSMIAESIVSIFNNDHLFIQMKKASLELIRHHDMQRSAALFEQLYKRHLRSPSIFTPRISASV